MNEGRYLMSVCTFCKEELTDKDGNEVCQTCWDKYKEIEYEVEFKVIGTFIDQVYECEDITEDSAIELVMDRLRTDPIRITDKDVDVVQVRRSEVVDHHTVRLFRTDIVVDHTDKGSLVNGTNK